MLVPLETGAWNGYNSVRVRFAMLSLVYHVQMKLLLQRMLGFPLPWPSREVYTLAPVVARLYVGITSDDNLLSTACCREHRQSSVFTFTVSLSAHMHVHLPYTCM